MTAALEDPDVRVAASPVWLRLVDSHTGRPPLERPEVLLELRRDGAWAELSHPHHLTPAGDLGFVGLGRTARGRTGTFRVRITVRVPRTQTAVPTGGDRLVLTLPLWHDGAPPTPVPRTLTFLPTPDYPFGAGVPLLAGRVVDAAGAGVTRASVSVTETVRGAPVRERTLSDPGGWFRLPVRWSSGSTRLDAVRGVLAGSLTFDVPDDLADLATVTVT